ncbi:hypothetical protein CHGG_02373 [Chaetomium globosum CBS 148.51]|nr:uncharacterized protein CHGG_02373 [Chaetomium globosum CBS 148.51]Q2HBN1.1 RecName: Full=Transcription factor cghF; AltName: Full=Sch210972 biosynthesis cluster protein F [Chaetomium globosum CBS 148.51]EAQ90438.1 hypothetical protein CHGG_02373 [Chaetomium globosum CBS 148.51]
MREHSHGANYVSSVHWAAVLDSISELIDQCQEKEKEKKPVPEDGSIAPQIPGPRLLYEPVKETKAEILASMPARTVVDRMVARYFNALGIAPAILHSAQFLREYESFWKDPDATPFVWIGLLFSVICLAVQFQQPGEEAAEWSSLMRIRQFHDRIVQCLVLGQYTRGGPYVVETMVNYCASELCITKDTDVGPWLPLGIMVPLAVSRGYHRDPAGFPNISPFAGEMRRRVATPPNHATSSTPTSTRTPPTYHPHGPRPKSPLSSTPSPRTESTKSAAPSRDLAADAHDRPYPEILALDKDLQTIETSLPPIFRWQPLSQSFMVPGQVLMFRLWLRLAVLRLVIWLHRKYLAPAYSAAPYAYSRAACARAALEIAEFQLLLHEETRPGGQLHQMRWMQSSLMQSTFLLGMSVACYWMQLTRTALPGADQDMEMRERIRDRLRDTYPLWLRCSAVSRDAREAAERLRQLPDLQGLLPDVEGQLSAQESPGSGVPACWDIFHGTGRHARALDAVLGDMDRSRKTNADWARV